MTMKEKFTNFINKVQLKKVVAGAVIGTMLMGGGFCLAHGHGPGPKDFHKDHSAEIQSQAAEKNITLIDEAKAKTIAAKAIGVKENDLTFRCRLMNFKGKDGTEFKPFYNVHAFGKGIMYSLNIDAVSGKVITDYDKDHFKARSDDKPQNEQEQ